VLDGICSLLPVLLGVELVDDPLIKVLHLRKGETGREDRLGRQGRSKAESKDVGRRGGEERKGSIHQEMDQQSMAMLQKNPVPTCSSPPSSGAPLLTRTTPPRRSISRSTSSRTPGCNRDSGARDESARRVPPPASAPDSRPVALPWPLCCSLGGGTAKSRRMGEKKGAIGFSQKAHMWACIIRSRRKTQV
jgi:hypothetical protein